MTHSPLSFITSLAFDCLTLDAYGYVSVGLWLPIFSQESVLYPPQPLRHSI